MSMNNEPVVCFAQPCHKLELFERARQNVACLEEMIAHASLGKRLQKRSDIVATADRCYGSNGDSSSGLFDGQHLHHPLKPADSIWGGYMHDRTNWAPLTRYCLHSDNSTSE